MNNSSQFGKNNFTFVPHFVREEKKSVPMLVAAALLIAYANAVPINLAARLTLCGGEITLKAGISAFIPPAVRAAKPPKRASRVPANVIFGFLRRLLARIRIVFIRAEGTVCARDAMTTALICGGAEIISAALTASGARGVDLHLTPDFSDGATRLTLQGMISIRTGQIITAAALCTADRIKGRFFKWTDR